MAIQIHNTLTRKKEVFTPADPERVTMYVCGPTVYNFAHIGNARPAVVFDVFHRVLKRRYANVIYARNITDVEDKINKAALDEGVPIDVINARYTKAYHEDMGALGVMEPTLEPRVTEHIPQIIEMIGRLVESGNAYAADGHVLFNVPSFEAYGALSRRNRDEMIAGARVEVAPYKKDPADFVLWKPSDDTQPGWDSPWGYGRPGWHIECSAMAETQLGETIDIHGGGLDLTFPHHENEIAQSTCAHGGALFSRYWMHNGFVNVDHEKMSKSIGNVLLVRDLLDQAPGEAIRFALLTAHYRQPLDWSEEGLREAKRTLDRLYGTLRSLGDVDAERSDEAVPDAFAAALEDDLNTPQAIAELHALATEANKAEETGERARLKAALLSAGYLLGILQADPVAWLHGASDDDAMGAAKIEDLIAARAAARKAKDFAEADRIRDELAAEGVELEDHRDGTTWKRVSYDPALASHKPTNEAESSESVNGRELLEFIKKNDVDQNEFEQILLGHFQHAASDENLGLFLPDGPKDYTIRLVYDRQNRITNIYASSHFTDEDKDKIINRVSNEILDQTKTKIGKSVLFTSIPVSGVFRYKDNFQILPVPDDAPKPDFQMADHPFILEMQYVSSKNTMINSSRLAAREREIELILSVVFNRTVRSARQTGRHHWVLPNTDRKSERRSQYLQAMYFWPTMNLADDAFSIIKDFDELTKVDPDQYYNSNYTPSTNSLDVPSNLTHVLDRYFALVEEKRDAFLRASFWYRHANQVYSYSHSAAFMALVSAIEALIPDDQLAKCANCGTVTGTTKLFSEFLERFAPARQTKPVDRKYFYSLRSKFSHGGALLADDLHPFQLGLGPRKVKEWKDVYSMWQMVQVALVNWLTSQ